MCSLPRSPNRRTPPPRRTGTKWTCSSSSSPAAGLAVGLAKGLQRIGPLMQAVTALAQPVLGTDVGPGDEPVERHRDVEDQLGHRSRLLLIGCSRDPPTRRESSLAASATPRVGGGPPPGLRAPAG